MTDKLEDRINTSCYGFIMVDTLVDHARANYGETIMRTSSLSSYCSECDMTDHPIDYVYITLLLIHYDRHIRGSSMGTLV